jgi:hypothetical protein
MSKVLDDGKVLQVYYVEASRTCSKWRLKSKELVDDVKDPSNFEFVRISRFPSVG